MGKNTNKKRNDRNRRDADRDNKNYNFFTFRKRGELPVGTGSPEASPHAPKHRAWLIVGILLAVALLLSLFFFAGKGKVVGKVIETGLGEEGLTATDGGIEVCTEIDNFANVIGWWRGENNANDNTPNYLPGTFNGLYTDGKVGKAFLFDGVNDYVNVAYNAQNTKLDITSGRLIIEAWFKPDIQADMPIVNRWVNNKGYKVETTATGKIKFWINDRVFESFDSNYNVGVWNHIAVTYIPGTYGELSIRINDDKTLTTIDLPLQIQTNNNPLRIGREGTKYFTGAIDELTIFGTRIGGVDVPILDQDGFLSDIYQSGSAGKCLPYEYCDNGVDEDWDHLLDGVDPDCVSQPCSQQDLNKVWVWSHLPGQDLAVAPPKLTNGKQRVNCCLPDDCTTPVTAGTTDNTQCKHRGLDIGLLSQACISNNDWQICDSTTLNQYSEGNTYQCIKPATAYKWQAALPATQASCLNGGHYWNTFANLCSSGDCLPGLSDQDNNKVCGKGIQTGCLQNTECESAFCTTISDVKVCWPSTQQGCTSVGKYWNPVSADNKCYDACPAGTIDNNNDKVCEQPAIQCTAQNSAACTTLQACVDALHFWQVDSCRDASIGCALAQSYVDTNNDHVCKKSNSAPCGTDSTLCESGLCQKTICWPITRIDCFASFNGARWYNDQCYNMVCPAGTTAADLDTNGDGTCLAAVCGNGLKETGEDCDGAQLGGQTCASAMSAGYTGELSCTASCTLNTASCVPPLACGNKVKDTGEACDGTAFGTQTCPIKLGPGYTGKLQCSQDCQNVITSDCQKCGNGAKEGTEVCETLNGAFVGSQTCASVLGAGYTGTLSCATNCLSVNTNNCIVTENCDNNLDDNANGLIDRMEPSCFIDNCALPDSKPVSWWPGENNAEDLVGSNEGTAGTTVSYAAGKVGQALVTSGANTGIVTVADSNSLDLAGPLTVEAWIYPTQSGKSAYLIRKYDLGGSTGYYLQITAADKIIFKVGNMLAAPSTQSVVLNQWNHVAGVFVPSQSLKVYVNGVPTTVTTSVAAAAGTNTQPLTIGGGAGSFFNGKIDEVAIYDRELTEVEIDEIMAMTQGKCQPAAPTTPGDVQGDGLIDDTDALTLQFAILAQADNSCGGSNQNSCQFGEEDYACDDGRSDIMSFACGSVAVINSDVNNDGIVNDADVLALQFMILAQVDSSCGGSGQNSCQFGEEDYACDDGRSDVEQFVC